jgi:FkbM family methyltransferase
LESDRGTALSLKTSTQEYEETLREWRANCWNRALITYGQGLPYFPGKWQIIESLAQKAAVAWNNLSPVKRRGILFDLDPIDLLQRSIYYLGVYEPWETRYLERTVKPGWVVVDAGANIGYYTLIFARLVGGEGCVLAFEPAGSRYRALIKNIALNGVANVRAFRVALADQLGECSIVQPHGANLGNFRLARQDEWGQEKAPLTTLDHMVSSQHLDRLDLIKVDIEGAEIRFLHGGRESIARFLPTIMIELNTSALGQSGSSPEDVIAFLRDFGYRFFRTSWKGLHPLEELPGPDEYFNAIATSTDEVAARG